MTTLQFRNVDFNPTAPVDQWPAEAIETVIDRGSLSDWRQLAQAIRRRGEHEDVADGDPVDDFVLAA